MKTIKIIVLLALIATTAQAVELKGADCQYHFEKYQYNFRVQDDKIKKHDYKQAIHFTKQMINHMGGMKTNCKGIGKADIREMDNEIDRLNGVIYTLFNE